MKKLIGTAMLAALLATSAFAEVSFGAWLRVLAAPVAGNGDDIVSGMTNSWGWGARVARADIRGTSEDEKAGFSMQIFNDVSGIARGDEAVLWVKPWDFLKVSLGNYDYTTFRGDLCFGSWNWIRPQNWFQDDEGLTFDKLGAKTGLHLELTPVEGLLIMWNLPIGNWGEAYKMFEQQDVAAKYTIGDIGTIKAGWGGQGTRKTVTKATEVKKADVISDIDGNKFYMDDNGDLQSVNDAVTSDDKYWGDVNVAFDLTAVENLYLTVGAKISIADSDYKKGLEKDFAFLKVAAGASYQILDNLKVAASFGVQTYENNDPSFQFGVGVDVGLTDSLTLNVDFRGLFIGDDAAGNSTDPSFSFMAGLQYACSSNGYVGIGFQGSTNGCGFLHDGAQSALAPSKADSFCWAVPIAIQVAF